MTLRRRFRLLAADGLFSYLKNESLPYLLSLSSPLPFPVVVSLFSSAPVTWYPFQRPEHIIHLTHSRHSIGPALAKARESALALERREYALRTATNPHQQTILIISLLSSLLPVFSGHFSSYRPIFVLTTCVKRPFHFHPSIFSPAGLFFFCTPDIIKALSVLLIELFQPYIFYFNLENYFMWNCLSFCTFYLHFAPIKRKQKDKAIDGRGNPVWKTYFHARGSCPRG